MSAPAPCPHVAIEELARVFHAQGRGEVNALASVSLQIERGQFVAVSGPSGGGKTTLLRLVAALDRPSSGDIVLSGTRYSAASAAELTLLRRRMGLVFQSPLLTPRLPVWQNVAFPLIPRGVRRGARRQAALAALERVGTGVLADALPELLSGGERQRVGLARALVTEPELVIADEPTAHLDADSADRVRSVLTELTPFATVIVATHDAQLVALADAVLALSRGTSELRPGRLRA